MRKVNGLTGFVHIICKKIWFASPSHSIELIRVQIVKKSPNAILAAKPPTSSQILVASRHLEEATQKRSEEAPWSSGDLLMAMKISSGNPSYTVRGVGGTVDSETALRFAEIPFYRRFKPHHRCPALTERLKG
ncbi:hypothetical protein PoB_004227500 [Plakobranchus ocellatus]|uniref:Uncharacterized protein n=1 Tax=Plakobranchus ocellatus TaxID=259542 RepID=A0AAV4B8B5_9GAST|nr:hypothetical protein PoB_004227500 [Plakobranchus ocellatus]